MARRQVSANRADRLEQKYGLTTTAVVIAITEERGLVSRIAQRLGITPTVLRDFLRQRDVCAMALKEARESMGDTAEKKLFEQIEKGDVRCIMYYLSTVHKRRGYGMTRDADPNFAGTNQVYVEQINVIGVPSGQFLSSEEAKAPLIEEIAEALPDEPPRRKPKELAAPADEPDWLQ